MSSSIVVESLTEEAFAPFGTVLTVPSRPTDIASPHNRYWDHPSLFRTQGLPQIGFLEVFWRPFVVESMERHLRHTQAFIPLGGASFIKVVAPPSATGRPDPAAIRAFYLDGSAGVVLHEGTWHHLLFPLAPVAHALLLLREGTKDDDMHVVSLAEPVTLTLARELRAADHE